MADTESRRNLGYQLVTRPSRLIKNVLDIYGEAGINTRDQLVATGGF